MVDPESVGMFAAVGAGVGAFLLQVWKQFRKLTEVPSVAPDRGIPSRTALEYDQERGRRLEDLRRSFDQYVEETRPLVPKMAVLESRLAALEGRIADQRQEILDAIRGSEERLDRRLYGIEAWVRK